jgi:two-component sensor histidine kinase
MAGAGSIWEEDRPMPVMRNGRRENAWWSYSYGPIDVEGGVGGILVVCSEVTAQHQARKAFKDQTRRFHQLFAQASGFMAVLRGPDHIFTATNSAFVKLIGERDFVGKTVREIVPEIAAQGYVEFLNNTYRTGEAYVGARRPITLQPQSGGPLKDVSVDIVVRPMLEENGEISGIFIEGIDVTDYVHAEQHLQLMNAEFQHRVKNILSIVDGIASQTLSENCTEATLDSFQKRLTALGRAHDILTTATRPTAAIHDVIESALAPHRTGSARISVSGPRIIIGSKQVLSLGMAIHELATNAIKYGALSNDRGRIDISWGRTMDGDAPILEFLWQERDGPLIEQPRQKGFGSGLIEGGLAWNFGARVDLSYEPSGFVCRLAAPMGNLG